MPSSSELRARARQQLGNSPFSSTWLTALLITLIIYLISSVTYAVSIFLTGALSFGTAYVFLRVARGNPNIEIEDSFSGFSSQFFRNMLLGIMQTLFIFLWGLLLIIPGIVKAYAYSMAFRVAVDHPDWSWKACLDESRRLMRGHKAELFFLDLSFIGWWFIAVYCCCGIGIFFLTPYVETARSNFYLELVGRDTYGGYGGYTDSAENEHVNNSGESKNTFTL